MKAYLDKHAWTSTLIREQPAADLNTIVIIPAYRETHILSILGDLLDCTPTQNSVEILVVINHAESATAETRQINEKAYRDTVHWVIQHNHPRRRFHVLFQPDLPAKKAGVGLARKIGMDEAVRRFDTLGNTEGVIVNLDADCRVQPDYLGSVERFFAMHPGVEGCSIAFAHPLDQGTAEEQDSIAGYELHLRYFIGMQRWAGYPFAYQTIGSAMAVRAGYYCKVGGMNMRKAGEDFYFLHKVIERGAFAELNETVVVPSPRTSDRVPFGTGRAMITQIVHHELLRTYHPKSFEDLKALIRIVPELYQASDTRDLELLQQQLPPSILTFLLDQDFHSKLEEIRKHTASPAAFRKRFFRWFNAFRLMKYLHSARDHFHPNVPIQEACEQWFEKMGEPWNPDWSAADLLRLVRGIS